MKIVKIINFKKKKKWEIYHKIQRFYLKKIVCIKRCNIKVLCHLLKPVTLLYIPKYE